MHRRKRGEWGKAPLGTGPPTVMSTNSSGSSSRSCKCGVPSPVKVSWTKTNPGRRFVGCTNYKTISCDSFEWIDPPISCDSFEWIEQ